MIPFCVIDYGADARDAVGRGPFETYFVWVVFGDHFVIRGGDVARGWIERMGQLCGGYEARPFVAALSGNGQQAGPLPDRSEAGGVLADISGFVGVDDIFGRDLPTADGGFELLPIFGAIDGQRG